MRSGNLLITKMRMVLGVLTLRYNFDDPTVQGDEETGSPKIGYAKGFPVPNSDQKLIVGSGIFLADEGEE